MPKYQSTTAVTNDRRSSSGPYGTKIRPCEPNTGAISTPAVPATVIGKPTAFGRQENSENLRHYIIRLENIIQRNSLCPCDACFMKMLHTGNLIARKPGYAYRKLRDDSILNWSRATLYEHVTRYTASCSCSGCESFQSESKNRIDDRHYSSKEGYTIDSWANQTVPRLPWYSWGVRTLRMPLPPFAPGYSRYQDVFVTPSPVASTFNEDASKLRQHLNENAGSDIKTFESALQGKDYRQHPYFLERNFTKPILPTQSFLKPCVVPSCCFFNAQSPNVQSSNPPLCEICLVANGFFRRNF